MHQILVLAIDSKEYKKIIKLKNEKIFYTSSAREAKKYIKDADIILADPPLIKNILKDAEKLKWFQSTYAGFDALLDIEHKNYTVTGIKDIFGQNMSEYILGYILMFERNILEIHNNQLKQKWVHKTYSPLDKKTIGIMGLGSIGSQVAKTAKFFNMRVHGLRNSRKKEKHTDKIFHAKEIEKFVKNLDYLVNILPHTKNTQYMLTKKLFSKMKNTIFINVGRGSIAKENDIIWALNNKKIKGAVLDVFEEEPLDKKSKLWKMKNVFITPHNAAYSFPDQIVEIFLDNYHRFKNKKTLKYKIDFKKNY